MLVRVYIWPSANIVDLKMYKHINKLENHLYIYFVIFFVAFCVFIYTDVTQKNIRMPHVPNILYIHKNSHSIQIQDGLQPFHSILLYLFSQMTSRNKHAHIHYIHRLVALTDVTISKHAQFKSRIQCIFFSAFGNWEGFGEASGKEKGVKARRRRWHLMIYSFLLKILDLWQSKNVYFDWIYYWEIPLR